MAKIQDTQKGINNTDNNKTIKAMTRMTITIYYTLNKKIQIKRLDAKHNAIRRTR